MLTGGETLVLAYSSSSNTLPNLDGATVKSEISNILRLKMNSCMGEQSQMLGEDSICSVSAEGQVYASGCHICIWSKEFWQMLSKLSKRCSQSPSLIRLMFLRICLLVLPRLPCNKIEVKRNQDRPSFRTCISEASYHVNGHLLSRAD